MVGKATNQELLQITYTLSCSHCAVSIDVYLSERKITNYSLDCSQGLNPEIDCLFVCLYAQSRDLVDRLDPRYLYMISWKYSLSIVSIFNRCL